MNVRLEISAIEYRQKFEKLSDIRHWFFEKINKIDNL